MEILFVVAIIGILMALLLPSIAKSKTKAKRAQCIANLNQHGIAFHSFAHDHQGRFPMQVSTNDGGSLEFMRLATNFGGEIYFSFRHYLALSRELDTPKILVCSTDTRLPAEDFYALRNENISYFIAGTAEYENPLSLLSGDRNIETYQFGTRSVVRLNADDRPGWTAEMHQFQGNLLFSDGHVEGVNNNGLRAALRAGSGAQTIVLAPVPAPPAPTAALSSSSGASVENNSADSAGLVAQSNQTNGTPPKPTVPRSASSQPNVAKSASSSRPGNNQRQNAGPVTAAPSPVSNATAETNSPQRAGSGSSGVEDDYHPDTWPAFLAQYITHNAARVTWIFLLVLLAIMLGFEIRRRRSKSRKQFDELSKN